MRCGLEPVDSTPNKAAKQKTIAPNKVNKTRRLCLLLPHLLRQRVFLFFGLFFDLDFDAIALLSKSFFHPGVPKAIKLAIIFRLVDSYAFPKLRVDRNVVISTVRWRIGLLIVIIII